MAPAPYNPAAPDLILRYAEAAALVESHALPLSLRSGMFERVPLLQAAGRVLAEPVFADRDQPPFPRSTRDGYACRAADLKTGPLRIIGQLRAGEAWSEGELRPGEAIEIMTGAPVPPGADCVVMIEHVAIGDDLLTLHPHRDLSAGENIVPAGVEARAGAVILPAGCRLSPAAIAAAAACGYSDLPVRTKPRVAVLATGDELVEVAASPLAHQIRNSNSYSLAAQIVAAGGTPVIFPIVRDTCAATEEAIGSASRCDLILLTGGVSMGKFDFVEQALLALGAEFFFTGARIQPGKPVVFGRLPDVYFFGLPGNPISTMVTFALFVAPLLRALAGESDPRPAFSLARLEQDVEVKPGLTRFLPSRLVTNAQGASVRRISWQGSGDLAAAAQANSFLVVPEEAERIASGEVVSVLTL